MALIPLPGGPLKTFARQVYDVVFALIALPIMWVDGVPDIAVRVRAFVKYSRYEDYPLRRPEQSETAEKAEALV